MHRSPTRKNHAAAAAASSTAAAASLWDGSGAGFTPQQLLKEPRSKRHLEGALKKYTNLLQGWQSRFFVLDPDSGQLRYYLNEALRAQQPPRGSLSLLGAMVISCDEFPFMFTVQATAGDVYKLRAVDAQEQEVWMMQLQLCSRRHSDCSAKVLLSPGEAPQKNPQNSVDPPQARRGPLPADEDLPLFKAPSTLSCLGECLSLFHHNIQRTVSRNQNQNQNHLPSPCPSPGLVTPTPTDRAPSWGQLRHNAPLNHVEPGGLIQANHTGPPPHGLGENQSPKHGLSLRTRPGSGLSYGQNQNQNQGRTRADSPGCSRHPSEKQVKNSTAPPLSDSRTNRTIPQTHNEPGHTTEAQSADGLFVSDESTDTEDNEEEELGVLDDQRSIIIHLLSQLKLGMDLTRVVLPTFILEKRSLLEMYANFMAHPDMFLSITSGSTPEERIVRFVEYYLTAFHEGRKGAVAKKPYNPILGETFHCSWSVPRDRVRPLRNPAVPGQSGGKGASTDCYCVRFVAEQVSHHPPVSGFYCECPERQMCVNAHVWTKSKFMGMSVGVSMVGEGVLYLLEHGEEYVFTLPCAYARSILTVPWVELGGKVSISCAQSGYSASVTFHTKPFYGGKVHRVTAEVKHNQTGNIVCKAQGEWNGVLEFTYSNGETKAIDTNKLSVIKKRIRAVDKQSSYESRRLWHHVTDSLKAGNMDAATEHKHHLEEKQRTEEKQRAATKTPWKPKYFIKQGEGWVYNRPLWETH